MGTLQSIEDFLSAVGSPEYGFLFLEPILIYGVGLGLLTFLFALLVKEQKTQMFGLLVIAVSAMMIGPYLNRRSAAQERIVQVYQIDQPARATGFIEKTDERHQLKWLYYLTAITAVLTLLIGASKNKTAIGFVIATVVLSGSTVLVSSQAHYHEAMLYYPNLQSGPSTAAPRGPMDYSGTELR